MACIDRVVLMQVQCGGQSAAEAVGTDAGAFGIDAMARRVLQACSKHEELRRSEPLGADGEVGANAACPTSVGDVVSDVVTSPFWGELQKAPGLRCEARLPLLGPFRLECGPSRHLVTFSLEQQFQTELWGRPDLSLCLECHRAGAAETEGPVSLLLWFNGEQLPNGNGAVGHGLTVLPAPLVGHNSLVVQSAGSPTCICALVFSLVFAQHCVPSSTPPGEGEEEGGGSCKRRRR